MEDSISSDYEDKLHEDKNTVSDVYWWALNESIELESINESVKFYRKLNAKIEAFVAKNKIKLNDI